jgi:thiol-disulfide isomerase/thioredoxin
MIVIIALIRICIADANILNTSRYYYEVGDYRAAAELTRSVLDKDPNDLFAHKIHVMARVKSDPYFTVKTYEDWFENNPKDPVASLVYAMVLTMIGESDAIEQLLYLNASEPTHRYWSLLLEQKRLIDANGDATSITDQLIEMGKQHSFAQSIRLRELIQRSKSCTNELQTEVVDYLIENPTKLDFGTWFWTGDIAKDCKKKFQKYSLKQAKKQMNSTIVEEVYAAFAILKVAEELDLAITARNTILMLDPMREPFLKQISDYSAIRKEMYDANRRPTHWLAIQKLEKLEHKIPTESDIRMEYNWLLMNRYEQAGMIEKALEFGLQALEEASVDLNFLNDFAYLASKNKMFLSEALVASNRSLEELELEQFTIVSGEDYGAWLVAQSSSKAAFLDTRGWVYYHMGEFDKARIDLEKAVELDPEETVLLAHLAFTLAAQEEEEIALQLFVEAINSGIPEEQLEKNSITKASELFSTVSIGWRSDEETFLLFLEESKKVVAQNEIERHPFIGKSIPIDEFEPIKGEHKSISSIQHQLLVVDLWATWCGPCVSAMPHLQEVALQYKDQGVVVVGLSVDEEIKEPITFFEDFENPAYTVGWIGLDGFNAFKVEAIPSLFIVNKDGVIVEYFSGYSSNSKQLENTIEYWLQK